MKIYISSTFSDLRDYRAAVQQALRRMGHDVIGMEEYTAEGVRPVERCLVDVNTADLYILLLAWRYGFVPEAETNPNRHSITRLEYEEAKRAGKTILAFMLDPATPWPPNLLDAMSPDARAAEGISSFRTEVGSNYLAGIFRTPDDLASQASVAVAVQGLSLQMAERLLAQTNITNDMGGFGAGSRFDDDSDLPGSSVESIASLIKRMVASARTSRALVLDLGGDYGWWSTRLFLLANLLRTLTPIRQIVFRTADGRFAGMASPAAVVDGLAEAFPILDKFRRSFRQRPEDQDTDRATDRQLALWEKLFPESSPERDIKVRSSPELLRRWIGDRLITSCIQIADTGPTMAQIQQIVESLIADVPVERQSRDAPDNWELGVVDRNAFSMELAREWVRSSLPRTTIR